MLVNALGTALYCFCVGVIGTIAYAYWSYTGGDVVGYLAMGCVVVIGILLHDPIRRLISDLLTYTDRHLAAAEVNPSADIVSRTRRVGFYLAYIILCCSGASKIAVLSGELWAYLVSVLLALVAGVATAQSVYRRFMNTRFGRWLKAVHERAGGGTP
jgi:hypothetical protein